MYYNYIFSFHQFYIHPVYAFIQFMFHLLTDNMSLHMLYIYMYLNKYKHNNKE